MLGNSQSLQVLPHLQLAAYTLFTLYNQGKQPEVTFDQKNFEFKVNNKVLDPRIIQDWMLSADDLDLLQHAVLKPQPEMFLVLGDTIYSTSLLEVQQLGHPANLAFNNLVVFSNKQLAEAALGLARKLNDYIHPKAPRPEVEIKMTKTHPDAKPPRVAYEGTSAAFDVAAVEDTIIQPYGEGVVPVGVKFSIDQQDPFYMQIHLRSSYGFGKGLQCHQGIVDSGYCGDFGVKVFNRTDKPVIIGKGDYFAQVLVLEKPKFSFKELNEQEWSEHEQRQLRGSGGFGSSGK